MTPQVLFVGCDPLLQKTRVRVLRTIAVAADFCSPDELASAAEKPYAILLVCHTVPAARVPAVLKSIAALPGQPKIAYIDSVSEFRAGTVHEDYGIPVISPRPEALVAFVNTTLHPEPDRTVHGHGPVPSSR